MRIALLTDGIQPYVMGGMQKHSYYLAKFLLKNKVHLDLYHTFEDTGHDIDSLEVFSEEEKEFLTSIVIKFPPPGKMPGHYIRRSYEYSNRIYQAYLKRPPVDFIIAKGFCAWKMLKEKKGGRPLPPIGVKFHGLNMFQKPPSLKGQIEQFMFRPSVRFNLKHADYSFSYGGKITDLLVEIGVPHEKIIDVPTGIERSWIESDIKLSSEKRIFLYVGRYERLKGVEELSRAIKLVKDPNAEFRFVGPIPKEVQIDDTRVSYLGTIHDAEKLKTAIRECDVLILPSYSEGMPNVILEAMACGLAIIATDVGAINSLVSKRNGILLGEPDHRSIKKAIENLSIMDVASLDKLKANSLTLVTEKFTWDSIADRLMQELHKRLIDQPSPTQ